MSLCSEVVHEIHRTIRSLVRDMAPLPPGPRRVLDVGCWDGAETVRYAELLGAAPHGVEVFEQPASAAEARGVTVARLDLEREPFPWEGEVMDVVIANQVFEHLKNVWLPMSEVFRVLRIGGRLILSVPNLASLHNRVLLGLGLQPTSIRTFGPHVRGYTLSEISRFVALEGYLELERSLGVGFYPFPARVATPIARLWPGASHTVVVVARKLRSGPGIPWRDRFRELTHDGLQTFYE